MYLASVWQIDTKIIKIVCDYSAICCACLINAECLVCLDLQLTTFANYFLIIFHDFDVIILMYIKLITIILNLFVLQRRC